MRIDWDAAKATLQGYLDRYAAEHTQPLTRLTHVLGIPMILLAVPATLVSPLVGAGLFAGGWALQFLGHYVFEKNRPAFYGDPLYLLIGPVWVAVEVLERLGVPLPDYLTPDPSRYAAAQAAAMQYN